MNSRALINQRCWHHPAREAVVRCPECRRFYCRECVVEHLGRMICSDCVAAKAVGAKQTADRSYAWRWSLFAVAGFLLAWAIFYDVGVLLARIPSDFFEGTSASESNK